MKWIVATKNPHKLAELQRILAPLGIEALSETELGIFLDDVEETGQSFEENAALKAAAACERSGLPAIADDSGLCVDALGGAPGVYSARYHSLSVDQEASPPPSLSVADLNIQKLLREMKDVPEQDRMARFVCVICAAFPDGKRLFVRGECEGQIAFGPRGSGGFGYDPVFLTEKGCFAELTDGEKDEISHRGRALRKLADGLKGLATLKD